MTLHSKISTKLEIPPLPIRSIWHYSLISDHETNHQISRCHFIPHGVYEHTCWRSHRKKIPALNWPRKARTPRRTNHRPRQFDQTWKERYLVMTEHTRNSSKVFLKNRCLNKDDSARYDRMDSESDPNRTENIIRIQFRIRLRPPHESYFENHRQKRVWKPRTEGTPPAVLLNRAQ